MFFKYGFWSLGISGLTIKVKTWYRFGPVSWKEKAVAKFMMEIKEIFENMITMRKPKYNTSTYEIQSN